MNSRFRICRFVCRSHYGLRRGDVFEGRTGVGGVSGYCGSSLSFEYDGTVTLISKTHTSGGITTKTEYICPYELVDGEFRVAYFDGGYFDADGKVHYYIPDYQGNILADVTAAGKVVQKASYYPYGEPWLEPEGDNRRLYGGKERLNFGPLRHSDYGPRLLDTRSGRWNSPDPCAEEFYPYSPYSVCFGDPINFTDPDGCRPSDRAAWLMAMAAYPEYLKNALDALTKEHWQLSAAPENIDLGDGSGDGLRTLLFEKVLDNGSKEYAYVYAGTDGTKDWIENYRQLQGESEQYEHAVENAKAISEFVGDSDLTFIGHSQGGGESAAASLATGREAITFNPAALSSHTISRLGLKNGMSSKITNFILRGPKININIRLVGDPVYYLQKNILNLRPRGKIIFLPYLGFDPHGIKSFSKNF